ncbi:Mitochondrial ribosomal protein L2, partial [Operophtera brumata]
MALNRLFASLTITPTLLTRRALHITAVQFASKPPVEKPKPGLGRVVAKGIGGGIKHKYHWVSWLRDGPTEGPPQEEKVIEIIEDGCRTAHVALVARKSGRHGRKIKPPKPVKEIRAHANKKIPAVCLTMTP